ncbi:MAG: phosphatidylglycerophosphatase A [Sulfurovum sp.]|nr:phosphatidylglycerophosphatase A [Sulfurovum sp.]MCB4745267.1 phosphatidylglycerophosphatase A [Sulfurovum sp.]MCB4745769.1 phosphatidylglycerophosphatase A [Sulfurovum sp.]MCB4747607.1 phosphatidylglycerophosphatase A [Sulfurovum sp.]MCB4749318.1 phosphatidylglycerophosphatase A [Sulfurovum sp.]
MNAHKLFITFLGTGMLPKPRRMATLLAVLIALPLLQIAGMKTFFMLTFTMGIISIFEVNKYVRSHPESDYKEITIDNVVGVWISLIITLSTTVTLLFPHTIWLSIVLSFASFTLFQVWKPSTIGWIAYTFKKGGLGIVLSSMLSGIAGGLLCVAILMGVEKFF